MKFLTKQGLQHFLDRLKGIIPSKTSDLTNDSGFLTSHNPVDSALSSTSTNAVQNKVVKDALDEKSDTGHTHSASDVSGLSAVATSGSYNDLTNKPTIPTVNNATLTIQKNGTTVKTFTANASSNVTANITVPTKTSDLTNDSGFLTSHNPIDSALSSTSTNAVQNKVVNDALTGKSDTGHSHTVSDISDFPTLSTVATTGSYNDLSNKPTIPTVNNKTLTIQKNGSNVATFTANSSSNVTANITVPTNVSELTNDSGFLTASSNLDSSKLTGTIDIARLPKGALERLVTVADQTARFALTTSDVQLGDTVKQLDTGVMYIVSDESKLSSNDGYTEYTAGSATSVPWSGVSGKPSSFTPSSHTHGSITNDGKLGTASRALVTDSSKKIAVSSVTSTELGYLSGVTSAIQTQLNGKSDSGHTHSASDVSGLSTVATTGSYNDLSNKPTIPTVNNATLTIQKNGSTVKTFTANASSNVTANITVPTKTSELTNDSHQTITTDTDTTSAESPAHSGTFTCIDSVTRDSNGHVTKVNTKTITLPADNNTDTKVTQTVPTDTVEWHNSHYRGINLISDGHFADMAALLTAIRNQDWSDIYIGDYVQFSFNYGDWPRTVQFHVGEIDKFYKVGNFSSKLSAHHLVMITGNLGVNQPMNDSSTTAGGYVGSKAHTETLPELYNIINPFFNNAILSHKEYLSSTVKSTQALSLSLNDGNGAVSYSCNNFPIYSSGAPNVPGCVTAGKWVDCNLVLMSEIEMFGSNRFSSSGIDDSMCPEGQIAVFKYSRSLLTLGSLIDTWLRNVNSATQYCYCCSHGYSERSDAAIYAAHFRPRFLIG